MALFYPDPNALLLRCESPAQCCTFNQWYSEVTPFCMEVPIIITGWKTDLHKDKSQVKKLQKTGLAPVTYPRGQERAKAMRAGDT